MADIVDLSSLIRRDETVDGTESFTDIDQSDDACSATDDADGAESGLEEITLSPSADGLIDFGPARRPGTSAPQSVRRDPMLDWSNQELADLVRVQRLLAQAGVNVSTDRGATDEGDPWFVFLDAYGEVFVHLSRIDGLYVLDSAVQEGVVTGPCFATLIERFAGRAQAVAAVRPDGKNVIDLKRGGKIVLHPGAALAALIWTILLETENLSFFEEPTEDVAIGPTGVDMAWEANTSDSAASDAELDGAPGASAFDELFLDKDDADDFLAAAKAARDGADRGVQAEMRDAGHSSTGVANSIGATGLGLTALAAAYGINRQQAADEAEFDAEATEVAQADAADDGLSSISDEYADVETDSVTKHVAAGHLFDGKGANADSAQAHAAEEREGAAAQATAADVAAQAAAQAAASAMESTDISAADLESADGDAQGPLETYGLEDADVVGARGGQDATTDSKLARFLESVGLEDLIESDDSAVTSVSDKYGDASDSLVRLIDETLTVVSFSEFAERGAVISDAKMRLPGLEGQIVPEIIISRPEASLPEHDDFEFEEFTTEVRDFIDHLVLNSKIEVIALENQIFVIDVRTLSDGGAEAFARTWSLDEDRTISTIGVKADFEAFDLAV